MAKYRKKPVVVEAIQWFKHGDHPSVKEYDPYGEQGACGKCGKATEVHGWCRTLEGGHIVCPGDFIITGVQGEHYPCKPDIFEATYEVVED